MPRVSRALLHCSLRYSSAPILDRSVQDSAFHRSRHSWAFLFGFLVSSVVYMSSQQCYSSDRVLKVTIASPSASKGNTDTTKVFVQGVKRLDTMRQTESLDPSRPLF